MKWKSSVSLKFRIVYHFEEFLLKCRAVRKRREKIAKLRSFFIAKRPAPVAQRFRAQHS